MIEVKWNDQATACRLALDLVEQADWAAVDSLTEEACAAYPESMALVGTRMNALFQLERVGDAVDVGVDFLQRFPDSEKIVRNVTAMVPRIERVKPSWLAALADLKAEAGRALNIRMLVAARRGVDANAAFQEFFPTVSESKYTFTP